MVSDYFAETGGFRNSEFVLNYEVSLLLRGVKPEMSMKSLKGSDANPRMYLSEEW